ncbi:MAG: Integrase family protein [uncultured Thiotrichaceae bacterium]|uniref:Integrase family protein n=1 Tax=uncultured Thiotrichaceae bacterium TaxID=298394 RepID=A0A6S6TC66_9GAMM|nr:MAG: Integrase family protein [uncultured Thiotrichaceae bacterium]
MSGYQSHKLRDSQCRAAKPKEKLYRLRDGGGLSLDILVSGSKVWRYGYRIHEKQKTFTIGNYPDVSLGEARTSRDGARKLVSQGIDPSQQKQVERRQILEHSFKAIADTWLEQNKAGWSDKHYQRIESAFRRDVYPIIGSRMVSEIEAPEIIPLIMNISGRGSVNQAQRTKGFISQVFDYALVHGKCSRNPAKDLNLSMLLPKTVSRHYAAITEPKELAKLLRAVDDYQGSITVKSALQLAPLTMARPAEITNAEWIEIDFESATWTIPAKRRKLPMHLKEANRPQDTHIVPLCSQALVILENIRQYTGMGKFIFPSPRGNSRALSNNALRTALRNMGYTNEQMTAHGFRGVASTLLNEQGFRTKIIEAQLAHKLKSSVEASYNHAEYLDERRDMLNQWGDYLESLKVGAEIVPFKQKARI